MAIGTSNARFECNGLTVDIGSHQWGVTDGNAWVTKEIGESGFGLPQWLNYGIVMRHREMRFVKNDRLIDQFRQLIIMAGRTGQPITFTPDVGSPGTFWVLDVELENRFERIVDNREEIVFRAQEQSPGL